MMNSLFQQLQAVTRYHEIVGRYGQIPGFLYDIEGFALHLLAADGPGTGVVAEIGSFKGKSTCFLASGCRAAGREHVVAIDHFQGSPEHRTGGVNEDEDLAANGSTLGDFRANLHAASLGAYVRARVGSTEHVAAAWHEPIRLLFIDGDHAYESVKRDFELFAPHVVAGGIVAFHDYGHYEGVTRFVDELSDAEWQDEFIVQTLAVVSRR